MARPDRLVDKVGGEAHGGGRRAVLAAVDHPRLSGRTAGQAARRRRTHPRQAIAYFRALAGEFSRHAKDDDQLLAPTTCSGASITDLRSPPLGTPSTGTAAPRKRPGWRRPARLLGDLRPAGRGRHWHDQDLLGSQGRRRALRRHHSALNVWLTGSEIAKQERSRHVPTYESTSRAGRGPRATWWPYRFAAPQMPDWPDLGRLEPHAADKKHGPLSTGLARPHGPVDCTRPSDEPGRGHPPPDRPPWTVQVEAVNPGRDGAGRSSAREDRGASSSASYG